MAVNKPKNDNVRIGAVRQRSQFFNERIGLYIKRNSVNGQFMDVKTSGGKFKGVRKEK